VTDLERELLAGLQAVVDLEEMRKRTASGR
jgi:hypothetical protein